MNLDYIQKAIRDGQTERFYTHRAWRRKKRAVLKRFNYECQMCKKRKKIKRAYVVHHVKPLRKFPELALSDYYVDETGHQQIQLLPLCFQCHEEIEGRGKKKVVDEWADERW